MREKIARDLVVMLTAGGALDDVLEMAKGFGVRAVHVQQLAVPLEELAAQRQLVEALRPPVHTWSKGRGDTTCQSCLISEGKA